MSNLPRNLSALRSIMVKYSLLKKEAVIGIEDNMIVSLSQEMLNEHVVIALIDCIDEILISNGKRDAVANLETKIIMSKQLRP